MDISDLNKNFCFFFLPSGSCPFRASASPLAASSQAPTCCRTRQVAFLSEVRSNCKINFVLGWVYSVSGAAININMKINELTSNVIRWEQIESVANWMNYGSSDQTVVADLLKFSGKFPAGTMSYSGTCYRAFGLSEKQVKRLLNGKTIKHRRLESWTTDMNGIKDFLDYTYGGSTTIEHVNYIIAVLKINPLDKNVFLNVSKLFKNAKWNKSIKYWENQKKWFNEGLDFSNSEKEIILANDYFSLTDIFAIAKDGNILNQIEQQLIDFVD